MVAEIRVRTLSLKALTQDSTNPLPRLSYLEDCSVCTLIPFCFTLATASVLQGNQREPALDQIGRRRRKKKEEERRRKKKKEEERRRKKKKEEERRRKKKEEEER